MSTQTMDSAILRNGKSSTTAAVLSGMKQWIERNPFSALALEKRAKQKKKLQPMSDEEKQAREAASRSHASRRQGAVRAFVGDPAAASERRIDTDRFRNDR